jgi:hypothetical protein
VTVTALEIWPVPGVSGEAPPCVQACASTRIAAIALLGIRFMVRSWGKFDRLAEQPR